MHSLRSGDHVGSLPILVSYLISLDGHTHRSSLSRIEICPCFATPCSPLQKARTLILNLHKIIRVVIFLPAPIPLHLLRHLPPASAVSHFFPTHKPLVPQRPRRHRPTHKEMRISVPPQSLFGEAWV